MASIYLTVRSKEWVSKTAYSALFDTTRMINVKANANTASDPALAGSSEFTYQVDDGRDIFYTVTETVAAIQAASVDGTITANVGSSGASTAVASETGDGSNHVTKLTLTNFSLGAIAAAADEATGALLYTLPAGAQAIKSAYIDIDLTNTDGNIDADTPDLGLGTTVASGAVAVLGGTAAFENILTGQTMADCNGTDKEVALASTLTVISTGDKTIYLNVADGWAGAETALVATGTITIEWTTLV